jgi:hypothetical protein
MPSITREGAPKEFPVAADAAKAAAIDVSLTAHTVLISLSQVRRSLKQLERSRQQRFKAHTQRVLSVLLSYDSRLLLLQ